MWNIWKRLGDIARAGQRARSERSSSDSCRGERERERDHRPERWLSWWRWLLSSLTIKLVPRRHSVTGENRPWPPQVVSLPNMCIPWSCVLLQTSGKLNTEYSKRFLLLSNAFWGLWPGRSPWASCLASKNTSKSRRDFTLKISPTGQWDGREGRIATAKSGDLSSMP